MLLIDMANFETPTAAQSRAARSLLGWSQQELAASAGVAVSTIADFERGQRSPVPNNALAIRQAFERSSIVFIDGGVSFGLNWTFKTETRSASLHMTFKAGAATAVLELASIFGSVEDGKLSLAAIQRATVELKAAVSDYVEKYGKLNPHLFRLRKMLSELREGEFFLLLLSKPASSLEEYEVGQLLNQLNHPENRSLEAEQRQVFGALMDQYDLCLPQTNIRNEIGNSRKADRKCRFCGGTIKTGAKFNKEAHAIPAALGNQLLKLNDECDCCNQYFGDEVEPALIELLNIQRVSLGITSRGARPTVQLTSGTMLHDGNQIVISTTNISHDASGALVAQLGTGRSITPQNIYRTLVKIALSVIPEDQLPALQKTAEWVRYGTPSNNPLPKVAVARVALPPNPSAQITLYIRKSANSRNPHVIGEFRVGCYLYVYALPFSANDDWDLVDFFDQDTFKNTFRHYTFVPSWKLQDYSGTREISIAQTIRVEQRAPAFDNNPSSANS